MAMARKVAVVVPNIFLFGVGLMNLIFLVKF